MPNYSKSEYDDRREAALVRQDALRKQDMAFKREMQGNFDQNLAARKAIEGDFRQKSDLQRQIQGTWDQKAAQERLIQGTFPEREAGLNTRQAAQLQSAMDIAKLHDTGAMDRARLAEQGAFDRATLNENAANWRHSAPQAAYHYVPLRGSGDDLLGAGSSGDITGAGVGAGNGGGGVAVFLNGQRVDQQSRPSLLAQLAPSGLKDANHLLSTLYGLPEDQREIFMAEASRNNPQVFKDAYNILKKNPKAGSTLPEPEAPSAAQASLAATQPAVAQAPFMLPDRVRVHSGAATLGGDTAPSNAIPTYGRGPYWGRGGPMTTPVDTDSYAKIAGPDPYAAWTPQAAPAPSTVRKPMPVPLPENGPIPLGQAALNRMGVHHPMPTPGLVSNVQRNTMPGRVITRKAIQAEEPEFLRQPF